MTAEEWVGQTIAGKYRVEALLGKGGMGLVLHARHIRLGEQVAIKVLLPAMLEVPGMTTRFLREAQAASKIKSRHVARVTDVDVLPDGTPYMIMEYLDGVSLAVLRRQRGTLEIPVAVHMVLEACDAIAEAHALGIVHRDLKPANLFLARGRDGEEEVKVLDFGISKVDAPGEQDTTKTGQMMGSPKYMAPEQMLSMHDVDGRSDIWSLGAILYDLIAGRTPFVAETTPQLCSLVLHAKPPPPRQFCPNLPEELEAIILRCLEREPAKRFATVADLVTALAPFAPPGTRIPPPPSSLRNTTGSWSGTRPAPPPAAADKLLGDEKPTEHVPAPSQGVTPAASASAPPLSARGGTVSVWNSAPHDRSLVRRRPRAVALGVVATFALAVLAGVAVRETTKPAPRDDGTTSGPKTQALGSPPTDPTTRPAPTASPSEPPSHPAASADEGAPAASSPSSTAQPDATAAPTSLPRGPLRPFKKPPETAPQSDPFAGKRR